MQAQPRRFGFWAGGRGVQPSVRIMPCKVCRPGELKEFICHPYFLFIYYYLYFFTIYLYFFLFIISFSIFLSVRGDPVKIRP